MASSWILLNDYCSPHWTIFGAPRKLGVSDWVQVPIEQGLTNHSPHAGICAGCALKAFEVQSPEMMTVVKLSQQPRIESCVVDR